MSKVGTFFKDAFSDMKAHAHTQKQVSQAEYEAVKAESRARCQEAKALGDPHRRQAATQAQADERIAQANARIAQANARIDAAGGKK